MTESKIMTVNDMVRGLVRAAELAELNNGGDVWDTGVSHALKAARERGWGRNEVGSLREQQPLPVPPASPSGFILNWKQTPLGWQTRVMVIYPGALPPGCSPVRPLSIRQIVDCRVREGSIEVQIGKPDPMLPIQLPPSRAGDSRTAAQLMGEFEAWCRAAKETPEMKVVEVGLCS